MKNRNIELKFPMGGLSGTNKEALLREVENAARKLVDAVEAVSAMTVHGRDYQQNPNDFRFAQMQHRERLAVLNEMIADLQFMYCKIQDPNYQE